MSRGVAGNGSKQSSLRRWASKRITGLSLEQKVGQMVVVGFPGTECQAEIRHLLASCHIGGVMLTEGNIISPAQTRSLVGQLQKVSLESTGIQLFVSVDQEGGNVSRFRHPATVLPTPMAIAATGSLESVERCVRVSSREMRAMGINVNFAPVLDVNSDHSNPVIGVRSFGDSAEVVAEFGRVAIETCQRNGIIATAKHFPGHGDTCVDSHVALPTVRRSLEELRSIDLPPFEAAIKSHVEMVMTAHIVFPHLSDGDRPATLSYDIVSGLLRESMGFEGIIVTDALVMDAVADRYDLEEATIAAVEAGADLVLMLSTIENQRSAYEGLLAAVKSGRLSEERIDQSALRILIAKRRLEIRESSSADLELGGWPIGDHEETVRDVARRAITLLRNRNRLLPIAISAGERVGVIEFAKHRFSAVEDSRHYGCSLASLVRARHPETTSLVLDAIPANGTASASQIVEQSDKIIIATRNAHLVESQASLVRRLIALGKPTAVVALRNPYDLMAFPEADCHVAAYGDSPCLLVAVRDVLFGDHQPSGKLPVNLPGHYERGYGRESY